MNRANGKGNIFETNVDRHDFVKTLADACEKTGFMFISELALRLPQKNVTAHSYGSFDLAARSRIMISTMS